MTTRRNPYLFAGEVVGLSLASIVVSLFLVVLPIMLFVDGMPWYLALLPWILTLGLGALYGLGYLLGRWWYKKSDEWEERH